MAASTGSREHNAGFRHEEGAREITGTVIYSKSTRTVDRRASKLGRRVLLMMTAHTSSLSTPLLSASCLSSSAKSREEIEEVKLRASQRALTGVRCRVSGTMLVCGVSLAVLAQLCYTTDAFDMVGMADCVGWLATCACIVLLAMAPMPGDVRLLRVVLAITAAIVSVDIHWIVQSLLNLEGRQDGSDDPDGCVYPGMDVPGAFCVSLNAMRAAYAAAGALFDLGAVALIARAGTETLRCQELVWKLLSSWFAMLMATDVTACVAFWIILGHFTMAGCVWFIPGNVAGILVAASPRLRRSVPRFLRGMFARRESISAAAAIASLVGNCTVAEVQRQANERFRCVPFQSIARDDLATNAPGAHLNSLARPCGLGACDAFVSHSWHDCAETKWRALGSWREAFADHHGREPSVWLDKYCIDQANIDKDLRSLPLFVNGCSRMVICCGVTYLRRLWCIMELFTFVHMGGDEGAIDLFLLLRQGRESEDLRVIHEQINNFDASQCECSNSRDRERMLFIIRAAYGDIRYFNLAVRHILADRCARSFDHRDVEWGEGVSSASSGAAV